MKVDSQWTPKVEGARTISKSNTNTADHTHGTSAQRMRWFRRGFDTGDARQCDTFGGGRPGE